MTAPTPNFPPLPPNSAPGEPRKTSIKRLLFAVAVVFLLTILALFLALRTLPTPAQVTPPPAEPAVVEEKPIEALITVRQDFTNAPRFACLKGDGMTYLTSSPSLESLYALKTSHTQVAGGGESVSWGNPECRMVIVEGSEAFADLNSTVENASKEFQVDGVDLTSEGDHLISLEIISASAKEFAGVAAVHAVFAQAPQGTGPHPDPIALPEVENLSETLQLLKAASELNDAELRDLVVSEAVVLDAVKLLSTVEK
ncbi:hypothetical protein ICM05_05345 [Leucobacter sp. cx-42]|uniref:hypothetical protein n=1 Tax=unclassified Leucobacter TaxID=2621730 RepID=UPI00165DE955|nr:MULTISPECIES: hypothetical protein [unclassified Leucobacter]MBC9954071.1 hypothetical protein [Leucobacter sp. cx-42]